MYKKELFIFDMDGVLIDSEPFWRQTQIELLAQFGITITSEDCIRHTMGKRIDDISQIWIKRFKLDTTQESLTQSILEKAAHLIALNGKAQQGIYRLIECLQNKGCRIALATSSSAPIISAVIDKLDIRSVFELTLSADEVVNGKPSPDVYLEVCRRLEVSAENTLALEDSLTGVRAAVAANITTIAIPEHVSEEFAIADHIVKKIDDVIDILEKYFN